MTGLPVVVMPDAEAAVRAWVRSLASLAAPINRRVFFSHPTNPTFPYVMLHQLGAPTDPYLPTSWARMSFDVWADRAAGGKAAASLIARTLAAEIVSLAAWTGYPGAQIDGAEISSGPTWMPDEDAHIARYVVDVVFTIRPVG